MKLEEALKILEKVPSGDYDGNMVEMFVIVAKKSEKNEFGLLNSKGWKRYDEFFDAIYPVRYSLGTLTNHRVYYTGLNDLDAFCVA